LDERIQLVTLDRRPVEKQRLFSALIPSVRSPPADYRCITE